MGARRKYPQFDDWSAEELAGLPHSAKLSGADKHIAAQRVVWHMDMSDAGAPTTCAAAPYQGG